MLKLKKDIALTKDCIEHWIRVRDKGESARAKNCALCVEYGNLNNTYSTNSDCIDCPIKEDSGESCEGTPYYHYDDPNRADDMIKYLKGLLKKLEKAKLSKAKLSRDIKLTKECILHWYRVGAGIDKPHSSSCSLCNVYFESEECIGCPIKEDTGEKECNGTPFRIQSEDQPIKMLVYLNELLGKLKEK